VYERALFGYAAQLSDAALAQVRADPDVAYVAQDGVVRAVQTGGTQSDPPWGLDRIDQRSLPRTRGRRWRMVRRRGRMRRW
jgi:hypothetical protein